MPSGMIVSLLIYPFVTLIIGVIIGDMKAERRRKRHCVCCDAAINTDKDQYVVGESLGEYWCEKCASIWSLRKIKMSSKKTKN
ncbi:hypothetical protein HPT25_23660 [Bacillus sp. BRMEA1]|uniref:hypothetical protein n=1 Tax=Neobacillus endophyticus TaxID=2738405 RepID=UPI001567A213|nr:hypothetical protein [Neobacillus endophyticus]NRD80323.1 hypothetical protein [Neobacillus endophyticus]